MSSASPFQYELSYTNILTILDLAGSLFVLKIEKRETNCDRGGPGALAPEPMSPFIDAFCVGDGEILVPEY